jgi:hypothetical protein
MDRLTIIVRADWDDEAKVWVATSSDVQGLAIEADTLEQLAERVTGAVADLIELNGFESSLPEIPIQITANQLTRVPNPRFA